MHTSLVLLAEIAEVIGCGKNSRRIQSAQLSAVGLIADYQRLAVLVEAPPLPAPVSRDPDDDHVLACALAAYAALIVSGDRDLLDLKAFGDIRIVSAREALEVLAGRG